MSYASGMAAINLEMTDMVPRTEYSAHGHWPLIKAVTGIDVNASSPPEVQGAAAGRFLKEWDYAFFWNILTHSHVFGDKRTKMGHAVFADGGTDYDAETTELFEEPEDVFRFEPFEEFGARDHQVLVREFNENFRHMQAFQPDCVQMTGIYITCVSGLIELLGWDMLLYAVGTDSNAFGEFTNRYCKWIAQYFEALACCESPVVMVHDDIVWGNGPFIHPDFYRAFVFPNYRRLFRPLIDAGKKILFTSDGNYTQFIDDIAACGVNGFVLEPGTDLAYIAEEYGRTHVIVGNVDTNALLLGGKEEIEAEVKRCMDTAKNCPGYIMAVGNHIPANTPVENALYYDEIYRKLARR